ncbi:MAG: transporter [Deltaproteobacteria bacterium]|nr:MAG: transporter [Deltaproteobacteria bacterium]
MLAGWEKALLGVLVLVLMTGMGATLKLESFKEVLKKPRGLLIGLFSQFGWMPVVAFGLARLFGLPEPIALSLLIVGCTPGGTTSNMFTYYSRANLALSVSMTVASTLMAVGMMPFVLWLYTTTTSITVPYKNIAITLVLLLIPVLVGVEIRRRSESVAKVVEKIGSLSGIGVLVLLIGSGLAKNYQLLLDASLSMYMSCIGLGVIGMVLGYWVAALVGLDVSSRRAVSLETGIQNSPLAIALIVLSFPESKHQTMLWLPLMYALFILLTSSLATLLFRKLDAKAKPSM